VRDLRRHEASIKDLERQLRAVVKCSGTTLTQIRGIGFLTAAKILALT
jgi:transposase